MEENKKKIVKEYKNDELTIIWKPDLCTHATFCWKDLIEVFNPKVRPWINPFGANSGRIIKQIEKCPSGALSYYMNNDKGKAKDEKPVADVEIEVVENGPLLVRGNFTMKNKNVKSFKNGITSYCRCGQSKNEPYCDGSHQKMNQKEQSTKINNQ